MFQYLEGQLRKTKDPTDAQAANILHAVRELVGRDIPIPELKEYIVQFSPEARKTLEQRGYCIYSLTGQSIASLKDGEHPIHGDFSWVSGCEPEVVEHVLAMKTEVAIHPKKLFLPRSKRKTQKEHEYMVAKHARYIERTIPGATAIMGAAPDIAELVFAHLEKTGVHLFGPAYDLDYTRTTTPAGNQITKVGSFSRYGLHFTNCLRDDTYDKVKVILL